MIKWVFTALLGLFILFDCLLIIACLKLEDREEYNHEQRKKKYRDD